MIALVDRALAPAWQAAPRDELRRARLLAGILMVIIAVGAVDLIVLSVAFRSAPVVLISTGVAQVIFGLSLLLLRLGRRSLTLPTLLLCGPILAVLFFLSLCQGSGFVSRSPFHMAALLLVGYLIGPRAAMTVGAVVVFELILSARLHETGFVLPIPLQEAEAKPIAIAFFDAVGIVTIYAIARLYESSREEAQRALALSEANLSTLIENTDASICYLDPQGHVLAANSTLKQRVLQFTGRELAMGSDLFELSSPEERQRWAERCARAMAGERVVGEEDYDIDGQRASFDFSMLAVPDGRGNMAGLTLFGHDVTRRKEAEAKLVQMHRQLVDASRQAGMAEVATGILHNVGNTLNSVNVSAHLIGSKLAESRVTSLSRLAELLHGHQHDLAGFLTSDEKGRQVPAFVGKLAKQLCGEREVLQSETRALLERIDHVIAVIGTQQRHAKTVGVVENVSVSELLDDALRLHATSLGSVGISVDRRYRTLPAVPVDRHKLLQIIVNLISNARDSLVESGQGDKRIGVEAVIDEGRVRVEVSDNGMGISDDTRTKLFQQGFTTKKTGHGFGLHMSALLATQMNGSLTCSSDGVGQGARFTIELPASERCDPARFVA
jgi:two-component system, LuxR family, sensor kinase FixL